MLLACIMKPFHKFKDAAVVQDSEFAVGFESLPNVPEVVRQHVPHFREQLLYFSPLCLPMSSTFVCNFIRKYVWLFAYSESALPWDSRSFLCRLPANSAT